VAQPSTPRARARPSFEDVEELMGLAPFDPAREVID
jgi:hypothetical protein